MRVSIVLQYQKWQAVDRAIEGLKLALYHAQGNAVEANLAKARIDVQLSQWSAAFGEYRTALGQLPNQPSIWVEFGRAAEKAGRDTTAREAYSEALRLSPAEPISADGLRRLEARRRIEVQK
jgi:Flp pilus assembly protein TadD